MIKFHTQSLILNLSLFLDSLNSNSYLSLLGCISPARKDQSETLSTIRFVQSVKTLENKNNPRINAYLEQKVSTSLASCNRIYFW